MSVAVSGHSPDSFEIKSANLPLLALRLKSAKLDLLAEELQTHYGELPDFFSDDLLVLDLGFLSPEQAQQDIDFGALVELLRRFGLCPVAVRGAREPHRSAALQAGLPDAGELRMPASPEPAPAAVAAEAVETGDFPGALVVDKPLRSGQQVYARGRDLVLLAMVNAGAEVIADGHIHVYAPLRGRAIAGARGWPEARIIARDMQPELVSIAGVYRTTDEPLPDTVWSRFSSVSLRSGPDGDKLLFEALDPR